MDKSLVSLESQGGYDGQNAGHSSSRGNDNDCSVPDFLYLRSHFIRASAATSTELTITKQINVSFFLHFLQLHAAVTTVMSCADGILHVTVESV